ncbi:MAG: GNAT family N-acetyltransferase [Anaerolineales bacterium]
MYPIQFSLKDGQSVKIRPMQLDDLLAIDAMHDRLSKQSLYYRYFVARKPRLDALREQMQRSQYRGAALVATLDSAPDEIIGMAYYLFTPKDASVAEPAILVEDRFQGLGLGGALFKYLSREALSQALHAFQFFVLPENRRMLRLLNQVPFNTERQYGDGVYEVRLSLRRKR